MASAPVPTPSKSNRWYQTWWFWGACGALVVAVLVIGVGGAVKHWSSGSGGTITFAEGLDQKTFKTTGEGTRFHVGQVWMIIRGQRPFGDTKLIIYSRVHGDKGWVVAREEIVDPQWKVSAVRQSLTVPGEFDIRVLTAKGDVVGQSTVEIVAP